MTSRTDLQTFIERAAEARAAADEAQLENVRDRCLRAAAAWDQMADRVRRTESMRAVQEADKRRAACGEATPDAQWPANIESKKPKISEPEGQPAGRDKGRARVS